jgi:Tol biopolymer transport system component
MDDWSRDGKFLLYHQVSGNALYVLPLDGPDRKPQKAIDTPYSVDEARISPDSKWVVYGSNESGTWQVYTASFPSFTGRKQISVNGGVQPHWRGDGKEIFFLTDSGEMMAADVRPGNALDVGTPRTLFKTAGDRPAANTHQFAVTSDGKLFYVREPEGGNTDFEITVRVNWDAALAK